MLELTFSSKLDWGSYIIYIAKSVSKKIGALIRSAKFLSPEAALYLYKSKIRLYIEYCCYVWAGVPRCYLDLLDKLQNEYPGLLVFLLLLLLNTSCSVPLWPSNFAPGIKTKFKDFSGEYKKN